MVVRGQRIPGTDRDKLWMSIRILRRFTVPDIIRTSGAKYHNSKNFVRGLQVHGYVAEEGHWIAGQTGVYRHYRLVKDVPVRPVICEKCGNLVSSLKCLEDL